MRDGCLFWLPSCRGKKDALRIVLAEAALEQGDAGAAFAQLRMVTPHWPGSTAVWNRYARCAALAGNPRHALKFLQPLRSKHPAALPLMLLTGHAHTLSVRAPV
jgi:predicted Zn-dependent protease